MTESPGNKNILIALLVVAAFLIGALTTEVRYLKKSNSQNSQSLNNAQNVAKEENISAPPLTDSDHVLGNRNSRLLFIVYSDLECPFCKLFHHTTKQILEEYKDNLAIVYRHFPLDIHPKARKEAEAVECAQEIGKPDDFWKLVDKIFEVTPSNNGLNPDDLPKLAMQIGLNENKFKDCLSSGKFAQRVESDYSQGSRAGISATPSSVIIDTKTGKTKTITGAVQANQIKSVIDSMLKE
ncbi:thioredoxin domain-containing protein [Candidatus Collierbacteria bacterium]|nr:thioredoxin domain-containing protein [Candidatus Collierbacteria bacterium]